MSRLEQILNRENIPSYIAPLFWQHGEEEHILREEIRQMHENGIGGFIVESRPHPDFLGEKWWRDLDIIIDEAKNREMKVWLFDDCTFPSGFSGGKIRDNHPEYLKVYMAERHIDALGPLADSSFMVKSWLVEDESIIRVIAALRTDGEDKIDGESLVDLTTYVNNGILYWDVPDGDWRIFIIVRTRNGGEEDTKHYLNPIEVKPVRAFIDYVYEEHYKRYEKEFGKTIAGFFSDEPRLGNAATYQGSLGKSGMIMPYFRNYMLPKMVLPYSETLPEQLNHLWDGDYLLYSPCLWYDGGPVTSKVRYLFMDLISKLFGESYTQQIGDWCLCLTHNATIIWYLN